MAAANFSLQTCGACTTRDALAPSSIEDLSYSRPRAKVGRGQHPEASPFACLVGTSVGPQRKSTLVIKRRASKLAAANFQMAIEKQVRLGGDPGPKMEGFPRDGGRSEQVGRSQPRRTLRARAVAPRIRHAKTATDLGSQAKVGRGQLPGRGFWAAWPSAAPDRHQRDQFRSRAKVGRGQLLGRGL